MDIELLYFDKIHAIEVHDWIIANTGGLMGIRELGQLESILCHIQNDLYYPTVEDKLTHLVFGISQGHVFNDGNKRSAISIGAYFLALNGYDYCTVKFIEEMENIVVLVAKNIVDKELLLKIITSILNEVDYSSELKLEIVSALYNSDYEISIKEEDEE